MSHHASNHDSQTDSLSSAAADALAPLPSLSDDAPLEKGDSDGATRTKMSRFGAALVFGAAVAGAAALGGRASRPGLWYRTLRKPAGNPPDEVFGPVWTALYTAMAASAYRVWRSPESPERTRALRLWALQLALNAAWSPTFFGAHRPRTSLAIVGALVPCIAAYVAVARKVDRGAAALMVPYLAWTSYATYLNAGIVRKN